MGDRQLGQTVHARMALVRAVEPLLDQMAEEATQAIWRDVPVYRDNPDANLRLQVVVHCRAVFETFLTILREDRLPTRQEFPTTRSQALFRVGQGVSLADFLRAFRVGQLTFWDSVRDAIGDDPALKDAALAAVSRLMQEIAAAVRQAKGRDAGGLLALRHDELLGLLPAASGGDRVIARLRRAHAELRAAQVELAIGASTVHSQLSDVPQAYREARVAREALAGCGGVLDLSSVSTFNYLVLSNDETAGRLIDPKIRQFVEEDLAAGGTYLETINAYVASDLNAKVAAEVLHLHVNTAYYRLERIAERTGLDLRKLPEVIDLLVAVRLLSPPPRLPVREQS